VSYDGNDSSDLGVLTNLNQVRVNRQGFAAANLSAPFPVFNYISYQTNLGYGNYNTLTVSVRKRFSRGLQFQSSYIWAAICPMWAVTIQ
jgi:hypothetical protein